MKPELDDTGFEHFSLIMKIHMPVQIVITAAFSLFFHDTHVTI